MMQRGVHSTVGLSQPKPTLSLCSGTQQLKEVVFLASLIYFQGSRYILYPKDRVHENER